MNQSKPYHPPTTHNKPTPMDVAVDFYYDNMGECFIQLYDEFLSSLPEHNRFIYHCPSAMILFQKETRHDPHMSLTHSVDPYWFIVYMGTDGAPFDSKLVRSFLRIMPYPLDKIAFTRYAKDKDKRMRFFKTNQLLKHYGIKT